jgi:WD40 repeat protein
LIKYKVIAGLSDSNIELWDVDKQSVNLTLTGHTGSVRSIKLLSDGVTLASASEDGTIKAWNINTGANTTTLIGHSSVVTSVGQLKNSYLISGSYDASIKIWDINSGTCVQTLVNAHNGTTINAVQSLNNGNFASGGNDYFIKIWNTSLVNYVVLRTLSGHTAEVWCLKELSDGTLASGSYDFTVKIWNVTNGNQLNSSNPLSTQVYAIEQVSSNPIILAVAGGTTQVAFLNMQTGQTNLVSPAGAQIFYLSLVFYNSTLMYGGTAGNGGISVLNPSNYAIGPAYSLTSSSSFVFCLEKSSTLY